MHALAPGALLPGTVYATWHFWRAGLKGNGWRRREAHMGLDENCHHGHLLRGLTAIAILPEGDISGRPFTRDLFWLRWKGRQRGLWATDNDTPGGFFFYGSLTRFCLIHLPTGQFTLYRTVRCGTATLTDWPHDRWMWMDGTRLAPGSLRATRESQSQQLRVISALGWPCPLFPFCRK